MSSFNPMNMIVNRLRGSMGNNPMLNNVVDMAQKNDVNGLEQLARNIGREKGIDVDAYYKQAMQMFGASK